MADVKPCMVAGCELKKDLPSHKCMWHYLLGLPIDEQIEMALDRRVQGIEKWGERKTVPAERWPAGRRFCSGCQWYIPMFYARGSRCIACASHAQHGAHLQRTYGITYDQYLAMLKYQGGRCYICRKRALRKRLAVDHNHVTNEVRGLLCVDNERGCNMLLGNIRDDIATAKRIVGYLENPPFRAVMEGTAPPVELDTAGPVVQRRATTIIPASLPGCSCGTGQPRSLTEAMFKMADEMIDRRARRIYEHHYSDGSFMVWPQSVWDSGEERNILNAVPDRHEEKVWERRKELFREKQAARAAR